MSNDYTESEAVSPEGLSKFNLSIKNEAPAKKGNTGESVTARDDELSIQGGRVKKERPKSFLLSNIQRVKEYALPQPDF